MFILIFYAVSCLLTYQIVITVRFLILKEICNRNKHTDVEGSVTVHIKLDSTVLVTAMRWIGAIIIGSSFLAESERSKAKTKL